MQVLGFHHFEEQASVKNHLTNDRSKHLLKNENEERKTV